MALIDHFLPAMAFAALLASEQNLSETPFDTARKDMDRLLDQALSTARQETPSQADNALFAACAFADEAILASSWPGRMEWMRRKLQQERFNTSNAGEEFYERLAKLCDKLPQGQLDMSIFDNLDQSADQGRREALEVYATCLTLGFRGKYYDQQGKARIDELTKTNLNRLHPESSFADNKVFPEIYAESRLSAKPVRLSPMLKLFVVFVVPALVAAGIYTSYAALLSTFVANWLTALG